MICLVDFFKMQMPYINKHQTHKHKIIATDIPQMIMTVDYIYKILIITNKYIAN